MSVTAAPSYPQDLFTDQVLSDPYEHYRALRDLGPVVWLDAHQMYAVARYAERGPFSVTREPTAPGTASRLTTPRTRSRPAATAS